MAPIPPEWQSVLGAPYLTGNAALSIINRTSSGPAVFGFNPSTFSYSTPTTPIPYVYYPQYNALGWDGSGDPMMSNNPYFNGVTQINGVIFVPGTRSVLFFGSVGTNTVVYDTKESANDPYRQGKGYHSLNGAYAYQVWAYDANDFLAVKNGQMQPWDIVPYTVWNFDFPQFNGEKRLGGVVFDSSSRRLYVVENGGDTQASSSYLPLIQVYQVTLN